MLQLRFYEVEGVQSNDPVLRYLKSSPRQLFDQPFAGYAIFLFGDSDSAVARWFTESLVSLDSLTADYMACVVFAKSIDVRGTITKKEISGYGPPPHPTVKEPVDLDTIRRGYTYQPLVQNATPLWNPSERDIRVVTYEVDRIAAELSVTQHLPCIMFFDAILPSEADTPHLTERERAVLPLKDNPGTEVIRFFRRVVQAFNRSNDLRQYVRCLEGLRDLEKSASAYKSEFIDPIRAKRKELDSHYEKILGSLASAKAEIPQVIAGASVKGLRRIATSVAGVPPESFREVENQIAKEKEELVAVGRTIHCLEYYTNFEDWPLSSVSQQRLVSVTEKYLKRWLQDIDTDSVANSRHTCEQALDNLKDIQRELTENILVFGPDLQSVIENTTNQYMMAQAELQESIELHNTKREVIEERIRELSEFCTSSGRPSLVRTVIAQLNADQKTEESRSGKPLSVLVQNAKIGDTYIVNQAGAVGPGASASQMTFSQALSGVETKETKANRSLKVGWLNTVLTSAREWFTD